MQMGYLQRAYNDIRYSAGWFGIIARLALVMLIPIFGIIVALGYAYGWARDMAWGIHQPMPKSIFENRDGQLYKRGFFVLVISVVFAMAPFVVGAAISLFGVSGVALTFVGGYSISGAGIASFLSFLITLVCIGAFFFAQLFSWVGSMRTSIYGRLSAGFQLEKMWKMIRRDFKGLLRIFGMTIVLALIVNVVAYLALMLFGLFMAFIAVVFSYGTTTAANIILGLLTVVLVGAFVVFLIMLCVFMNLMTVRALGHWTMQFEIPLWGGQDDPMPFERAEQTTQPTQQNY